LERSITACSRPLERIGRNRLVRNIAKPGIVRRRTCIASIIQTQDTPKLLGSSLCPISWESKTKLVYRRTLILFNELHASQDRLNFKDWISPEKTNIWEVIDDFNLSKDNEVTTIAFIHRLTGIVWQEVVHAWRNVIDKASEHIRTSVRPGVVLCYCPLSNSSRGRKSSHSTKASL
jgi:hypothetical protein